MDTGDVHEAMTDVEYGDERVQRGAGSTLPRHDNFMLDNVPPVNLHALALEGAGRGRRSPTGCGAVHRRATSVERPTSHLALCLPRPLR